MMKALFMPIHLRENQYRGVNAHLQSSYQTQGGWSGFHSKHISDLAEHIDTRLPDGYEVDIEQSVPATEELHYTALRVFRVEEQGTRRAILHIELLSPTNKGDGSGALQYIEKRVATLKSGLRLVEIDYLHETRSPIRGIPHYPIESDAFPYYVHIADPFPTYEEGIAATYGFYVDDPIPPITLPLLAGDMLKIDFQTVYDTTFKSLSAFSRRVDYAQPPENFDAYNADDQARIHARMHTVQAKANH